GYWTAELPLVSELRQNYVADGGTWGQPFPYTSIAHIIIPRKFTEEYSRGRRYNLWSHEQDLDALSNILRTECIPHIVSAYVLEAKVY
ncbi:hypothetical protein ACI394_28250, partial [Klebsiella pneumoniae]|uniref:hypothetical protein n=1 Tax=Klebsiella pneumoniae TaxID=573 RepID=UPI003853981A